VQLAAARSWAAAVRSDGTVWTWGSDGFGKRTGDPARYAPGGPPTPVQGLAGVRQVALGEHHGCALREDGTVWCWGSDHNGLLGDPARWVLGTGPFSIPGSTPPILPPPGAATGSGPAAGVSPPGVTVPTTPPTDARREPAAPPTPVPGIAGATAIAAFAERTAAVVDGQVRVWGRAAERIARTGGAMGTAPPTPDEIAPARVPFDRPIQAVALGPQRLVALGRDGSVWAGGRRDGWPTDARTPADPPERVADWVAAEVAAFTGVAVRLPDGTVRVWGGGDAVRGDGMTGVRTPSALAMGAVSIAAGRDFVVMVDRAGAVWG